MFRTLLGTLGLALIVASCGIDTGLKKEFRQSRWQSFAVEVTATVGAEAKGKDVFVIESTKPDLRAKGMAKYLKNALKLAGYKISDKRDSAALLVEYTYEFKGSGIRDWVGSYNRIVEVTALSPQTKKKVWEYRAQSEGTFDYPDERLFVSHVAPGIDWFGKTSRDKERVLVHEDNKLVKEIRGESEASSSSPEPSPDK